MSVRRVVVWVGVAALAAGGGDCRGSEAGAGGVG